MLCDACCVTCAMRAMCGIPTMPFVQNKETGDEKQKTHMFVQDPCVITHILKWRIVLQCETALFNVTSIDVITYICDATCVCFVDCLSYYMCIWSRPNSTHIATFHVCFAPRCGLSSHTILLSNGSVN